MKIMSKLLWRTPVYTVLLALLLAVGVAFSSIGAAFYQSARLQQRRIDSGYITTVIPFNEKNPGYMPVPFGTSCEEVPQAQVSMEELLQGAPVEYQLDRRVYLGAVVKDMESWTPAVDPIRYSYTMDDPYSMSVFAVRCDAIESVYPEIPDDLVLYDADGNPIESDAITAIPSYAFICSVLEPLCLMDQRNLLREDADMLLDKSDRETGTPPEQLYVIAAFPDDSPDGSSSELIFSEGKTYLVLGSCHAKTTGQLGASNFVLASRADSDDKNSGEDWLPYVEYTGSLEDFLSSEEGSFWRDTIIPGIKRNYHTVKLMLSDNVSSMYWFNTGEASILEGRMPTEEEYREGKDVCLISADYADINQLSLGDTLTMDLYHPDIAFRRMLESEYDSVGMDLTYMQMDPCMPDNSLDVQKEYTVVGIYTAPAFGEGLHAFHPDMVFAPQASVPGATEMEEDGTYIPLLNSAMIPNGSSQQLLEFLAAKGYKDSVLLLDQGYTEASDAVDALMANALRLFAAGAAVLVVTAGLFLFLCLHKMRPTVVSLRRMGVRGVECWRQIQLAMVPVMTASVVLGTAGSIALFGRIGKLLLSAQMELPLTAVLLDAVGKLILLFLLESLCARGLTKVGLMQKGKRKRTS